MEGGEVRVTSWSILFTMFVVESEKERELAFKVPTDLLYLYINSAVLVWVLLFWLWHGLIIVLVLITFSLLIKEAKKFDVYYWYCLLKYNMGRYSSCSISALPFFIARFSRVNRKLLDVYVLLYYLACQVITIYADSHASIFTLFYEILMLVFMPS